MAILKMSVAVRNAMLDAIENGAASGATTGVGTTAVLKIRSGAMPTNITDADAGNILASMTLPADYMQNASAGSKAKSVAAWTVAAALGGTAGHFRLYASDGTTQHIQGDVTATGGGGAMTIDNVAISGGQAVTITGFTLTAGNA